MSIHVSLHEYSKSIYIDAITTTLYFIKLMLTILWVKMGMNYEKKELSSISGSYLYEFLTKKILIKLELIIRQI